MRDLFACPPAAAAVARSQRQRTGSVELETVHRFTHSWERAASLRLRRGDVDVLDDYERHDRIHDGSLPRMETEIIDRWTTDRAADMNVLLIASTNDTVDRLNRRAQQARMTAGELDTGGFTATARGFTVAHG